MILRLSSCFTTVLFLFLFHHNVQHCCSAQSVTGISKFERINGHSFVNVLHRRSKRDTAGSIVINDDNDNDDDDVLAGFDLVSKLSEDVFNITAFNRTFRVKILSYGNSVNQRLLTPDFQVFTVSASGDRQEIKLHLDKFFTGILEDEDRSEVFGYIDENRQAMMTITTVDETYSVEPLHRFSADGVENHDYIIYRASDLRMPNNSSFCGAKSFEESVDGGNVQFSRAKRDTPDVDTSAVRAYSTSDSSTEKDSCELCLTADYTFYGNNAHNGETAATNQMIYLVSQVNSIYRKEPFGNDLLNFGFTIKRIEVHQEPTITTDNPSRRHYNAQQAIWDQGVLLESFSRTGNHAGCCLSHLFTHRPFDGGVLGLAYLANADMYKIGGICSSAGSFFVNTGWSSTMFADGSIVPSQQAVLVLAHELGHNWGSPHDLDTKECAPSSNFGGKYIMWMYSVPGYETNNWHFSSCSLSAIGEVIRAKGGSCFKPRPRALCGNGFVEGTEECDAGPVGLRNDDKCCNPDCTFRSTALCSDVNQVCCRGCKPASANTLCWQENDMAQSATCLGRAFCNGTTAECQPREPLSGKPCFDNGQCRNGTCLPFCEVNGYKTCMCDKLEFACNYCCFVNQTCVPLDLGNGPKILSNGRPCPYGVCEKGMCKKTMMNTVEKFWSYLTEIDVNNLAKFMRDNIVGVTIVIALVVWIPLSCTIWCLDRRQEKMLEESWERRQRFPDDIVERRSKIYYLHRSGQAAPAVYVAPPAAGMDSLQAQHYSLRATGAAYNRAFSLSPSQLDASGAMQSRHSTGGTGPGARRLYPPVMQ